MWKRELVALLNFSSCCLLVGWVALPHGAVGLSAVYDCGISSYSLTIFLYFGGHL